LLKFKPLGLIKLENTKLSDELVEWLKSLPTGFVVYTKNAETKILSTNIVLTWKLDETDVSWFDFIVCDNEIEELYTYIEKWITPIIIKENHMWSILKEFDPIKNEWNAFFYEESNKWNIFYTIVRYIENYKFPYDNKNLVKNILKV
jgi:hypothetical protein